jgi:hypothetical protein
MGSGSIPKTSNLNTTHTMQTTPRAPRTITSLQTELRNVIEILEASMLSVTSDYHLARAVSQIEAALSEIYDLALHENRNDDISRDDFIAGTKHFRR